MDVLHICVRNDGLPPHKETFIHKYPTHVEAVQGALDILKGLDDGEWDRDLIARLLAEGRAIWVWEWRRKGNGDYVIILDTNNVINHLANIDFHDSVTLDEDSF